LAVSSHIWELTAKTGSVRRVVVDRDRLIESVPTYRGEGKKFG
jgi:hypothetical protein